MQTKKAVTIIFIINVQSSVLGVAEMEDGL